MKHIHVLVALFVFEVAALAQNSPPGVQKYLPSKHSGAPAVGELQAPQESPQDYARRQIRENRYSEHSVLPAPVTDPGMLEPESSNLTFIDYVALGNTSDPHGIPASVSTAIVIGTVVSGKSFVNSDHNFVYTDYKVRVDQVLKQDPAANLKVGAQVTAARPGGSIRFPSGHVTNFLSPGHGFPVIGSHYVLFLWRAIPDLPEYEIIIDSGYELKNGRAYALDDANSDHDNVDAKMLVGECRRPKGQ